MMVIETLGAGVLVNLAYDTLRHGKAEVDEEQFLHDSLEEAVETTAERYRISPAALEAVFTEILDEDTVENFHQQDQEDVLAELADALAEQADEDVDVEKVVHEFVELFQRNLARRPSHGIPILVSYIQQLSAQHPELSEIGRASCRERVCLYV